MKSSHIGGIMKRAGLIRSVTLTWRVNHNFRCCHETLCFLFGDGEFDWFLLCLGLVNVHIYIFWVPIFLLLRGRFARFPANTKTIKFLFIFNCSIEIKQGKMSYLNLCNREYNLESEVPFPQFQTYF